MHSTPSTPAATAARAAASWPEISSAMSPWSGAWVIPGASGSGRSDADHRSRSVAVSSAFGPRW